MFQLIAPKDGGETALARWQRLQKEGRGVSEHVLNVVKAALSAAPIAGAIASLMSDYIPSSSLKLCRLPAKVSSPFGLTTAPVWVRLWRTAARHPAPDG